MDSGAHDGSDKDETVQYGLIAEEVEDIYPELVAYDEDGQPLSVSSITS